MSVIIVDIKVEYHHKNNVKSLKQVNRIQCILALAYCAFAGITIRIVANGTDAVKVLGINIYQIFTILSNTVCAVCSLLTMSYCIEGLRHQNYCKLEKGDDIVVP